MTENKPTQQFQSGLAKANNIFLPMIMEQLQGNGIQMSDYQRTCTLNAMTAISATLNDKGLSVSEVDSSNITNILLTVSALELNASADPREVYFIVRNHKNKQTNQYYQEIEMGIEGDGNDALLARFGRNVKNVYPFWAVREGDGFEYPKHIGIQTQPPSWTETGNGKVIRVVYPVELMDGTVTYLISEREDVRKNLIAHVANNLLWDKGTAKDDFMAKSANMTLDQILNDPQLLALGKVSPAWSSPQSRESMVLRKMRNNVVKKFPKDFGNKFQSDIYEQTTDENYKSMRKDVTEHANKIDFDAIPKGREIEPQAPLSAPQVAVTTSQVADDSNVVDDPSLTGDPLIDEFNAAQAAKKAAEAVEESEPF